ncbi:helix-turn-helix domain-containing protein [Pararhodobacter sp.]|uniref:AraC-like ligand-binding domain-containing protein n=1 Tax=Pararhodobacter sp. TaxID=2127056 RepID=UPI002AFEB6AF|nr:helix-turn-helix domain-containing protein [Pararhodobacter sp.]
MGGIQAFTTAGIAAAERAVQWNNAIAAAYFPLSLRFSNPFEFSGKLDTTSIGRANLSHLVSQPVQYERRGQHIKSADHEDYLITIPLASSVEFRQLGREVSCDPGGFIIERGDEPYRFSYSHPNDLYVLKVCKSDLSERIRQPDQYCARVFDATQGVGALFVSMVKETQFHASSVIGTAGETLSRQLLELLALAIKSEPGAAASTTSSVRAAHLLRIEKIIHQNLKNPDLSPDFISEACGISKRYLHDLFKDLNGTVAQQIREQRLLAAKNLLRERPDLAVADVAYRFGFTDQAQFSRLFKAKFKVTPTDFKRTEPLAKTAPADA